MRFDPLRRKPGSCGFSGIEDARRVARQLDIPHLIVDLTRDFSRLVIRNFCREYLYGRTPNPCVRCNQFMKFGILLKKSIGLKADFLATGHYARVVESKQGYLLKRARDYGKDQSYFLYRLSQEQLEKVIFPLGEYTKVQVRLLAERFKFDIAAKPDSQEICFLPEGGYPDLIGSLGSTRIKPGELIDKNGVVVGRHKGIPFYTVGQRQGLGIAKGYPVYVTSIDARKNRIFIGSRSEAFSRDFLVKDIHFLNRPFKKKIEIKVKIRYNHKESFASAYLLEKKIKVSFEHPQFAVTPGQSAVFYQGDTVLGGGIIEKVLG
jgi:tRNA-specific 2-thiouridylase